ncbi:extracellular catalytic domain type 1 short-chain-length polyhydroxyalkanoate depolymerase [Pontibaca methylaminivorans]|uniref:Esterase, PHB depolymerase family n=1 Tax=Pontibaca methylaminivorans TaxID=515897 RepID=A0A1R3WAT3_9RHOB|nr:PHB depolymerase family esterase [Pontibaca methylaminivorans]SIT74953.1 esterase, PHB depolymerase family [Pontibaca methylaminivorans]
MKVFDADALRRKIGGAGAGPSYSANLVRDTLARHGLMPGHAEAAGRMAQPGAVPAGLLAGLNIPFPGAPQVSPAPACPEGASFDSRTFVCAEGRRTYLTYVPASLADQPAGIVVMLHGCTQTAADFATGTAMNILAERDGFIVVYPEQERGANAQTCWNWFAPADQQRDHGEPAILAGITRHVMKEHTVGPERTFIAGLSAGAAMALIMVQAYPDIFAAAGLHSGLPYGAGHNVPSAFAAMSGQANGARAPLPAGETVRLIVFHGNADHTVHPSNGAQIMQQALAAVPKGTAIIDTTGTRAGRDFDCQIATTPEGLILLESWVVDGLGHAWSGGDSRGSYTDAQGPAASDEMVRFFFATGPG